MSVSVRPSPGSAGGLLSRLAIQKYCSISFLEVSGVELQERVRSRVAALGKVDRFVVPREIAFNEDETVLVMPSSVG